MQFMIVPNYYKELHISRELFNYLNLGLVLHGDKTEACGRFPRVSRLRAGSSHYNNLRNHLAWGIGNVIWVGDDFGDKHMHKMRGEGNTKYEATIHINEKRSPWSSNPCVSSCPITTPMPPKFKDL